MSLPLTHKHQHENQHESHKKVGLGGLANIYIYISNIILLVNVVYIRVIPINILPDNVMKTPILVSPVGPEHITIGIQRSQHTSKMELVGVIPFYQFR